MNKEQLNELRKLAENLDKKMSRPLKVCIKSCDQCLFSNKKIVSDTRKEEILKICAREQTHFICHKGTIMEQDIVCNGFYRNQTTPYLELMKKASLIEFVDPNALLEKVEHQKSKKQQIRTKRKSGKGL